MSLLTAIDPTHALYPRVICICVLTLIVSKGWPTVSCAMPATVPAVRSIAAFMDEDWYCCCWAPSCHVVDPRCTVVSGGTGTITDPSCRLSIEPLMGLGCAAAALMSNSKCRGLSVTPVAGHQGDHNLIQFLHARQARAAGLQAVMQLSRRVYFLASHRSTRHCV